MVDGGDVVWEGGEIEAINSSSLFQGRIPQEPEGFFHFHGLTKNHSFLVSLARDITGFSSNEDACVLLDKWSWSWVTWLFLKELCRLSVGLGSSIIFPQMIGFLLPSAIQYGEAQ